MKTHTHTYTTSPHHCFNTKDDILITHFPHLGDDSKGICKEFPYYFLWQCCREIFLRIQKILTIKEKNALKVKPLGIKDTINKKKR